MAFAEEVAIFAETNLGTRIVMTVPLDITATDFKRQLEKTHASCISSLGEIRVHGLMVKRNSRFYYLPDSLPLKYIFRYNQKPWFIHAEATLVNVSQEPSSVDKRVFLASEPETITSSLSIAEMKNSECFNSFVPKTPESVSEMISKKLIVAANNIRMRGKTHVSSSLSSSIFRSNTSRQGKTVASLAKFMVFQIPNTDG